MTRLGFAVVMIVALAGALSGQSRRDQIPTDGWPTFNGDYTGRRFSTLTKITADNVKHLSLAWSYRLSTPVPARSRARRSWSTASST